MYLKTNLGALPKNGNGTAQADIEGKAEIDLAQAKILIAKYGSILAYQIIKGVKTVAQANAELTTKVAARKAAQQSAQPITEPSTSGIMATMKQYWPWLLAGALGLVLFRKK
jgi:hypothetical protein